MGQKKRPYVLKQVNAAAADNGRVLKGAGGKRRRATDGSLYGSTKVLWAAFSLIEAKDYDEAMEAHHRSSAFGSLERSSCASCTRRASGQTPAGCWSICSGTNQDIVVAHLRRGCWGQRVWISLRRGIREAMLRAAPGVATVSGKFPTTRRGGQALPEWRTAPRSTPSGAANSWSRTPARCWRSSHARPFRRADRRARIRGSGRNFVTTSCMHDLLMCCHPAIQARFAGSAELGAVGPVQRAGNRARVFGGRRGDCAASGAGQEQIREQALTLYDAARRSADLEARLWIQRSKPFTSSSTKAIPLMRGQDLIRKDLCFEALRLGRLLASSSIAAPRVHALVAVMALQAARLPARIDEAGDLILLEDQDRARWDQGLIAMGFLYFDLSMAGDRVSEYHAQAAIAATHARAESFWAVNWAVILELLRSTAGHQRRVAGGGVGEDRAVWRWRKSTLGRRKGWRRLPELSGNPQLRDYYLLLAVRGHLLLELERREEGSSVFARGTRMPLFGAGTPFPAPQAGAVPKSVFDGKRHGHAQSDQRSAMRRTGGASNTALRAVPLLRRSRRRCA